MNFPASYCSLKLKTIPMLLPVPGAFGNTTWLSFSRWNLVWSLFYWGSSDCVLKLSWRSHFWHLAESLLCLWWVMWYLLCSGGDILCSLHLRQVLCLFLNAEVHSTAHFCWHLFKHNQNVSEAVGQTCTADKQNTDLMEPEYFIHLHVLFSKFYLSLEQMFSAYFNGLQLKFISISVSLKSQMSCLFCVWRLRSFMVN